MGESLGLTVLKMNEKQKFVEQEKSAKRRENIEIGHIVYNSFHSNYFDSYLLTDVLAQRSMGLFRCAVVWCISSEW